MNPETETLLKQAAGQLADALSALQASEQTVAALRAQVQQLEQAKQASTFTPDQTDLDRTLDRLIHGGILQVENRTKLASALTSINRPAFLALAAAASALPARVAPPEGSSIPKQASQTLSETPASDEKEVWS